MMLRRFLLLLFLLPAALSVRGQELRTAVPDEGGYRAAGECLAWLDARGNVLRTRPLAVPLVSLALFGDACWAVDAVGRELLRLDGAGEVLARVRVGVRGRIRALSSDGDGLLAGVTDAGEIFRSRDGRTWDVFDFNAAYAGFYPRMDFRAVAVGGGSMMVAGLDGDGRPAAFTSSRGTVWSRRSLDYSGGTQEADTVPVSLSYDAVQDRFYLAGSGGVLLSMPGCTHCNRLDLYPADTLFARIPSGFSALLLGSGGFRTIENPESLKP